MNTEYEIKDVIIEKIYKSEANKDGKPYMSSKGNPFVKVDIFIPRQTINDPEFQGKVTYFDYYDNTNGWMQGFPITGKVIVKESNGRKYFNFELPSKKKELESDYKELEKRVRAIEEKLGIVSERKEIWNTMKEVTTPKDALDFSKKVLEPIKEEELDDGSDLPF